jgi:hypothetical protein
MSEDLTDASNSLNKAIAVFGATEANLDKLDRIWHSIKENIPDGVVFGNNAEHENLVRAFSDVADNLPAIDGWRLTTRPLNYDEIGQVRFDAKEAGEIECVVSAENHIFELDSALREYRFRLNRKRRHIVRAVMEKKIETVDFLLAGLHRLATADVKRGKIEDAQFASLQKEINEIDTLIGGSVKRPPRWSDLSRHLHFAMQGDLKDIIEHDWPAVKPALLNSLVGENDPIPTGVQDLGELVVSPRATAVVTALNWSAIDEGEFERLLFNIISNTEGYENPQWLMQTSAPDRGRDLSVSRVIVDKLGGTTRNRVIIQCKHWLSRSISVNDIAGLKAQLTLWEPPLIDVCIVATSGRFTGDAVAFIEKECQTNRGMKIEMWPESHLEKLLAQRPGLIAEFGLR